MLELPNLRSVYLGLTIISGYDLGQWEEARPDCSLIHTKADDDFD